jgi:membrane protein
MRFTPLVMIAFHFIRAMKPASSRDVMLFAANGDQMSRAVRFQGILRRLAIVDEGLVGIRPGSCLGRPVSGPWIPRPRRWCGSGCWRTQMVPDGSRGTPGQPASGPGQPPRGTRAGVKADGRPRVGWRVRRGIEAAEEKYSGSAAEDLWHRLDALDFMNQAMILTGTLLLCALPFLLATAGLAGVSAESSLSRRLGLNQQAAADFSRLFTSSGATSAPVTGISFALLVLFGLAGVSVIQELYLRAFGLDPRGVRDLPRKLISLGLTVGWLFLTGLVGPSVRAGGPVLFGIVILVAFTGFWWLTMRFLLAGRIPWRRLFPSAVATGLCWLGMVAVFSATFSGMVISSYNRYGPIGIVFDIMSYLLAIGVVIILGAVAGIVWRERGLSFQAAFGKLRRPR